MKIGSDWWKQSLSRVYPTANDGTPVTVGISRSRLTGFASGTVAESVSIDIYGNQTTSVTTLDRTAKTVTQTTTYPDSSVAAQTVTVNGLVTSARSKSNLTTTFGYDALGRRTSVTDPRTGTSTVAYFTDTNGKKGKVQSVTDAANKTTTYDYDTATGRRTSVLNALGKYTRFAYNSYGQTTRVWGDTDYPVEAVFNSLGQQTELRTYRTGLNWNSVTWPGENETPDVTSWTYDASSGLVTAKTDAASKSTAYTYSNDGRLATRTWARLSGGQPLVTTYSYNSATGELTSVDYSDSTTDLAYTYNRLGQTATVTDAAGSRTFTYNTSLDLTGEAITGIYSKSLTYSYATSGVLGRYTGMLLDNNSNHAYSYDAYGRLSGINVGANAFAYTRLTNSELIETLTRPNSVNTAWSFEANRNLVSSVANGTISTYSYVNDDIGRRTSMSRSGSVFTQADTLSYSYNDRSEVTGALSSVKTDYNYTFGFDPIGNRLNSSSNEGGTPVSRSYTANLLNQYTSVSNPSEAPTYDFDGNMLTRDGWTQSWNAENQLVLAVKGTDTLEFSYDYMGRRVEKKIYSGETLTSHLKFVYDGYKLIEELDALNSNASLRRYTWQDEEVGLDVPLTVYDVASEATYFYHTDANKNVTELTDISGNIVAHYEYSPFGKVVASSGAYASTNPFRFSSEYHDDETGLVYYNYRYYSPDLGRWLSRDPIEELGGLNLYGMVSNNPIDGWDSLGEDEQMRQMLNIQYGPDAAESMLPGVNSTSLTGGGIPVNFGTGKTSGGQGNPSNKNNKRGGGKSLTEKLWEKAQEAARQIQEKAKELAKAASDKLKGKSTKKDPCPTANNKGVVIGENMNRVKSYAEEKGYDYYKGMPGYKDGMEKEGLEHNRNWYKEVRDNGRDVFDIGPDFNRRKEGRRSANYEMERMESRGYEGYQKNFERSGKTEGGVPGFD